VTVMTYEEALRIARERLPDEQEEDSMERWARNMPKPEEPPRPQGLDTTPIDWDARIAALISAERDFIIEVVGQALGEFRSELLDEIDKMIAEEVEKLRTEAKKNRESSDGEVVLLPNPLRKRAGRG
jgi:hypothetical protein